MFDRDSGSRLDLRGLRAALRQPIPGPPHAIKRALHPLRPIGVEEDHSRMILHGYQAGTARSRSLAGGRHAREQDGAFRGGMDQWA
ncbi:hypothetical protein MPLA_1350048 [Mesorhizobium sp. ORS 3359]|nr:hypothetical protein MPLA_1350048 [Mesorhizobium sp. ORS 3359]